MEQETPSTGGQVTIPLTSEEALVLFELLSRWVEVDTPQISLEHPAEYRVLWDILAVLEKTLVEPFMPDYRELVENARRIVRGDEE
ncbi:MAG: hypothetical protein ACXWQR_14935 [Ktedonobacterales bacterium]